MTVRASGYERKKNELYETAEWATRALLARIRDSLGTVLEPAAGNHKMADVIRMNGHQVVTSDIETYDRQHDFIADFLDPGFSSPKPFRSIITNPPYGKQNRMAVKFCELALERAPDGWVAMLLTAKFDFGKTRAHLFRDNDRFAGKIAFLDRIRWFPGEMDGSEDHCWCVWRPSGLSGDPVMRWVERKTYDELWDGLDMSWPTTT